MEDSVNVTIISITNFDETQKESIISDLDNIIDQYSVKADKIDYVLAASSGLICGVMDTFFPLDFSGGREIMNDKVESFVKKVANKSGCQSNDMKSCVSFLEKKFKMASDGNIHDFGGALNHHLRDFSHHASIIGLTFSLLTQFTGYSYGTDTLGKFIFVPVSDSTKYLIGKDEITKIINGTLLWFLHLVSDVAGSNSSIGKTGGTGIPGPILSLAKLYSTLPIFKNGDKNTVSKLISKLFNGTLFMTRGADGKPNDSSIYRMDLRGELGIAHELIKLTLPVLLNEIMVRTFYSIHRFYIEAKESNIKSISEIKNLNWKNILPFKSPTLTRMITISSSVFTGVDIVDAVVHENVLCVNFVGVGRFTLAIGSEFSLLLRRTRLEETRNEYKRLKRYLYSNDKYSDLIYEKLALTVKQVEILYNIERVMVLNDIDNSNKYLFSNSKKYALKSEWLLEWQKLIEDSFSDFVGQADTHINWYSSEEELTLSIKNENPSGIWFKTVMLEAMVFSPYYPLCVESTSDGKTQISQKYKSLNSSNYRAYESTRDTYLDSLLCKISIDTGLTYEAKQLALIHRKYNCLISELGFDEHQLLLHGLRLIATHLLLPGIGNFVLGMANNQLSISTYINSLLAHKGCGPISHKIAGGTILLAGGGVFAGMGITSGHTAENVNDIYVSKDISMDYVREACKLVFLSKMLADEVDSERSLCALIKADFKQKLETDKILHNDLSNRLEIDPHNKPVSKKLKNEIDKCKKKEDILTKLISEIE